FIPGHRHFPEPPFLGTGTPLHPLSRTGTGCPIPPLLVPTPSFPWPWDPQIPFLALPALSGPSFLDPWTPRNPPNLRVPPVLHSLRYLSVAVTEPSPGIPQYLSMGYVDGIPITRYDSERGQAEPLTPWMAAGAEPGYWDEVTQIYKRSRLVAADNLETVRDRYNQSGGLHTWQRLYGCDLLSDGSVRGSDRFSFDGRDFISFELGSGSFVAADGAAQITKRKWEHDGIVVERLTHYLENTCPEALRRFVGYGREALECKEPPDVHVSGKEEHGI
ncbi:class I histocompatibility antigen, F10 alpha chain-like, partial [Neopelma chrysocephalum]|uniref:class I histocompatibility antigen, F10 alpha chain-like n=1 Tax=Neopelma chrysocephalum TaxID=114329 RepID=UPI000FCD36C2